VGEGRVSLAADELFRGYGIDWPEVRSTDGWQMRARFVREHRQMRCLIRTRLRGSAKQKPRPPMLPPVRLLLRLVILPKNASTSRRRRFPPSPLAHSKSPFLDFALGPK
jgi:hypothetical protein